MMTTRRRLVALGLALAGIAGASDIATAKNHGDPGLARAVQSLRAAMLAADKPGLDKYLADDVSFGHANGVIQTKAEFMAAVLTRAEVFKTITLTDQSVRLVGTSAIVRQTFTSDLELDGKPLSVKLGELQIWQKQAGGWRMIARQAFRG